MGASRSTTWPVTEEMLSTVPLVGLLSVVLNMPKMPLLLASSSPCSTLSWAPLSMHSGTSPGSTLSCPATLTIWTLPGRSVAATMVSGSTSCPASTFTSPLRGSRRVFLTTVSLRTFSPGV